MDDSTVGFKDRLHHLIVRRICSALSPRVMVTSIYFDSRDPHILPHLPTQRRRISVYRWFVDDALLIYL